MDQQKEYSVEERMRYGLKAKRANVGRESDCGRCLSGNGILQDRDTIIEELVFLCEKNRYTPSADERKAYFTLKEFDISKENEELISKYMNPMLLKKYLEENIEGQVYIWLDNNNNDLSMSRVCLYREVIEAVDEYFENTEYIDVTSIGNSELIVSIKY